MICLVSVRIYFIPSEHIRACALDVRISPASRCETPQLHKNMPHSEEFSLDDTHSCFMLLFAFLLQPFPFNPALI